MIDYKQINKLYKFLIFYFDPFKKKINDWVIQLIQFVQIDLIN